jgi:hypothetical protein
VTVVALLVGVPSICSLQPVLGWMLNSMSAEFVVLGILWYVCRWPWAGWGGYGELCFRRCSGMRQLLNNCTLCIVSSLSITPGGSVLHPQHAFVRRFALFCEILITVVI